MKNRYTLVSLTEEQLTLLSTDEILQIQREGHAEKARVDPSDVSAVIINNSELEIIRAAVLQLFACGEIVVKESNLSNYQQGLMQAAITLIPFAAGVKASHIEHPGLISAFQEAYEMSLMLLRALENTKTED